MITKTLVWTQFAVEEGRAPEPPEFYVNAGDKLELYIAREESEEKQMLYLVHKHTKEHRRYDDALDWPDNDCMVVGGDPDGWIEHDGRGCPLPKDTLYEVKDVRGDVTPKNMLMNVRWEHKGDGCDIIAYRPILDADTKVSHPGTMAGPDKYHVSGGEWPEPPAWNGEGLPPVGCECEFRIDHITWVGAEILAHRDGSVIVWTSTGDAYYSCDHRKFRPIRSEEDRAVEEMESIWEDAIPVDAFCRALYRAGYRKTSAADGEEV